MCIRDSLLVDALIEANPDCLEMCANDGATPFHVACQSECIDVLYNLFRYFNVRHKAATEMLQINSNEYFNMCIT